MTREQQRKLRELKKAEPTLLKKLVKQYKLRKKDYMIWTVKGDLFFTMYFFENELDGKCYCSVEMRVKPLWADDILWDLLGMSHNRKEPLSLRSIGAFTVMGAGIESCRAELPQWGVQELEALMDESFQRFSEYIRDIGIEYYLQHISDEPYHTELRELTLLIHQQRYDAAISYAESMEHGYFQNGSTTTHSGAVEYCRARLRERRKVCTGEAN